MPAFTWENTLWCVSRERVSIRPFYTAIFNASKGLVLDSPGTHARLFASFWPSCNDAPAPSLERPRRLFGQHSTDASADMSTSDEKVWQTTAVQNLVRYRSSGTYFARFRVGGKLVWKSLKTATSQWRSSGCPTHCVSTDRSSKCLRHLPTAK